MEQNRSDLFCSRVAGTFYLLHATIFFNLKKKNDYGAREFFEMRNVALHAHEKSSSDPLALSCMRVILKIQI